jgi:hypothetical protein
VNRQFCQNLKKERNIMDAVFAAIDLTTAAAAVGTIMVASIGINMAFKAGVLGKRAVKSV